VDEDATSCTDRIFDETHSAGQLLPDVLPGDIHHVDNFIADFLKMANKKLKRRYCTKRRVVENCAITYLGEARVQACKHLEDMGDSLKNKKRRLSKEQLSKRMFSNLRAA
jgi:hypothetical protein